MPSSSSMSGKSYVITEVELAWKDNGNSYWTVFFRVEDNNPKDGWYIRVWARDELAAYAEAIRKLDGAK